MARPYIQITFRELLLEFDRAKAAWDVQALSQLSLELDHRQKTSGAPHLKADVLKAIDEIELSRGSLSLASSAVSSFSNVSEHRAASSNFPRRSAKQKFPPTAEQADAIQNFIVGDSLKINAYSGTGKTSTLQMLADATSRRGQYIAFNRDIVAEAKERFPRTVNCSTSHSLAMKAAACWLQTRHEKADGQRSTLSNLPIC